MVGVLPGLRETPGVRGPTRGVSDTSTAFLPNESPVDSSRVDGGDVPGGLKDARSRDRLV